MKAASFRARQFALTQRIDTSDRKAAWNAYHNASNLKPTPNQHQLSTWARALVYFRALAGPPIPAPLATEIENRADRIYLHWREFLRYHAVRVPHFEVQTVRRDVHWFRQNYPRF